MKNAPAVNGKRLKRSIALATAVLGSFVLFAGAGGAQASDRDDHGYDRQRRYSERRGDERGRFEYANRDGRDWRAESYERRNHERWGRENFYQRDYRERGERRDSYRGDRDRDRW
jgi:hypothetical protein